VECIAASFICTASDILDIKKVLAQHGAGKILVIAKIENAVGVKNFDTILQVADGIMVARGDLGVELPITEIPRLQKEMIRKCYHTSKPVITATQMLESMISSPRPTRAEVSDVANAIYDHSSAVMLSGETAVGKYPIEAVKMMKATTLAAEEDVNYAEFFYTDVARRVFSDISSCVALAAVKTAYSANGKALIAFSTSGFTARLISRFRPQMPIIALTPDEKTYHQLAFNWGVVPFLKKVKDFKEGFAEASSFALRECLVSYGDLVVATSGTPFGVIGTTNVMIVDNIGDVLIRTAPSEGKIVHGSLKLFPSDEMLKRKVSLKGKIAVLSRCDGEFEPFLKGAAAILLQNHPDDSRSEWEAKAIAKALKIPCLVRADGAFAILKDGEIATLDPGRGLLFKGIFEAP
ncbi:MAG: pyruvate kinase, partial [Simkania negevensis]|nr:pyruvate kinase [Simkania negevensis]